ncbi:MAG TPA: chaperonin GroEL [Anaerolineae bacterium]
MTKSTFVSRPSVEFQPSVHTNLIQGLDLIADTVRPTIGPLPRYVGYESITRTKTPELLSDAGTLARRIIQLGDEQADVGAMLMRQAIWQVSEKVGDGSATTAVMAQAMVHYAHRMVAAGANAMRVRDGIRLAVEPVVRQLQAAAKPVSSQKELTNVARSYCHDAELSQMLGEIYSIIGASGYVEVQSSSGRTLEREYVEGAFWRDTGWISAAFGGMTMRRAEIQDAAIMLVDGRINDITGLAKAVGQTLDAGHTSIGIICNGMSDAVISVLATNHQKGTFKCLPIKAPASNVERKHMFDDISIMTGGTVLAMDADADMSLFSIDMLGSARRLWSDTLQFGFVSGKGSPKALRAHIAMLRKSISLSKDKDEVESLRKRIGRLTGGTALLSVGAYTEAEQKLRKDIATRSVSFMNTVSEAGMVAGGGAALLDCQDVVRAITVTDDDVRSGIMAVARALEEPMRALAANAGMPETATIARARREGNKFGLNVLTREMVNMEKAGIIDSANVLAQAVRTAASVASMLISTDVVIRHRTPETAAMP